MTNFNLPDKDELEIEMRKRIAELEKSNQELRAEIRECKRADEVLSRERNLLESVMQTTDVMLAFLDPQFNFVWVNPAYAETCRMKPEDMVGKNHFVLYPHEENEAIFRKISGRSGRLSRSERFGQDDDDPHAAGSARAERWQSDRAGIRRVQTKRRGARARRIHVAEVCDL